MAHENVPFLYSIKLSSCFPAFDFLRLEQVCSGLEQFLKKMTSGKEREIEQNTIFSLTFNACTRVN